MSRFGKWQSPTQKGTELAPVQTSGPAVVRVVGTTPGSVEERRVLDQHRDAINAFHRQSAHNYSLSDTRVQKIRRELPGASMVYANIAGQEYLTIKPHPVTTKDKQVKKGGKPFDWAVVEIWVPTPPTGEPYFGAVLRFPDRRNRPGGYLTYSGRFETHYDDGDQILDFPDRDDTMLIDVEEALGTDAFRVSLKVDLRDFPVEAPALIDVYGYMEPDYSAGPLEVFDSVVCAVQVRQSYNDNTLDKYTLWTGYNAAGVEALFPELAAVGQGTPTTTGGPNGLFRYNDASTVDGYYGTIIGGWAPGVDAGWKSAVWGSGAAGPNPYDPNLVAGLYPTTMNATYYEDGSPKTFEYSYCYYSSAGISMGGGFSPYTKPYNLTPPTPGDTISKSGAPGEPPSVAPQGTIYNTLSPSEVDNGPITFPGSVAVGYYYDVHMAWSHTKWFFAPRERAPTVPTVDQTRDCPVKIALLYDPQDWQYIYAYGDGMNTQYWTTPRLYPQALPFVTMNTTAHLIQVIDPWEATSPYYDGGIGMPKLGTVSIDRMTGAVGFTPV